MKRIVLLSLVFSCVLFAHARETNDVVLITNAEPWTIERFQREFCGEDDWEPFNRTMFAVFDWCMEYVADPFCYVYSSVIPKPLIQGINNFSEHVEYPRRLVSSLGCAEWAMAWCETQRFFINSTVGLGGLFDPAQDWFLLFDSGSSLSDVFAYWNVPAGPPLVIPFLPRASVRGHVGYLLDYAFDAKTWFDICVPSGIPLLGYSWALAPNKASVWRGDWETLVRQTKDPYVGYMSLMTAVNEFNLRQTNWHYREKVIDQFRLRAAAKALPDESPEQKAFLSQAKATIADMRPPVRAPTPKPANLKGRWRTISGYAPRSPALDSLRALAFAPIGDDDFWWERRSIFNSDFSKSIEDRTIEIAPDLPKAAYSFLARPSGQEGASRTEKLAFVLPGIGSGRTANDSVAMAEILNQNGYTVAIVDSIFHWEYVQSANRGILPGNLTEDFRRLGEFLAQILGRIQEDEHMPTPEVSLVGWSMGALSVFHLAALADRGELPFGVHRFLALNPPTSLEHALVPFDKVLDQSKSWKHEDVREMFTHAAPSLYGWAAQKHPRYDPESRPVDEIGDPWDYAPNLTDEQAQYLFALTLNKTFPELIEQYHQKHPFPWIQSELTWFRRRDFRREVGAVMMREYINRYVPTCYEGVSPEEMIATADVRHFDSTLRGNKRLRVIHTRTDPLQTPEDRDYLDAALGDRITWFDEGAHCGYFYTIPFRDELLSRLEE